MSKTFRGLAFDCAIAEDAGAQGTTNAVRSRKLSRKHVRKMTVEAPPLPRFKQRMAVSVPAWHNLPESLRAQLGQGASLLGSIGVVESKTWEKLPVDLFAPLFHDLSDHFIAANGLPEAKARADDERRVLDTFGDVLVSATSDLTEFCRLLDLANAAFVGQSARRTASETSIIRGGTGDVRFIPTAQVTVQLKTLMDVLATATDSERALFNAAAALVILTNAHPYRDGNGRLGRMLFNLVLRRSGMSGASYVALSEMANRSRGGYEIRLRQAEVLGQWEPFLTFILSAIELQSAAHRGTR